MNEPEIKSKAHNFGKDFDLNSQEIEKTNFFLVESQLKDFSELVYLCSSINKKYTALLYREKDHSYLYLFILKHIINKPKENISYKIKAKLKFNKAEIDKTALEDKQMFIDDQANKNTYNEYSITLVNKDLILLQVIGKKIMIVNFDKKEYTVLFCNSSDKKSIQVVSTYDELIVTKKDNVKKFQIRTYIFCISSGKLYFFIINEKVFTDCQFLLYPFPFGEDYSDCIDFEILRINSKESEGDAHKTDNKYYFVFIVLLNGKFIRYVTDWVNCGLKEILLNFHKNMEKKIIKRSIDCFDKGNNNCGLKVYRSEKCASFIILQIGFHIFTFKYYETDSPIEIMKRFGIINDSPPINSNLSNNTSSHHKDNNNNNNLNFTKAEEDIMDTKSLKNSTKNNTNLYNTLNDSLSMSKASLFQPKTRHGSLANINITHFSTKNSQALNTSSTNINKNNQISIESSSHIHMPSLDHTESNITFNEIKETKDQSAYMQNNNNKNVNSELKTNPMPEFKTKDKDVVYYSLEQFYDLNFNEENNNDDNAKNSKDNLKDEENSKMNETYVNQSKNIIYSFTYHSFVSFIQTSNNVIVCNYPDKIKEKEGDIEKVMKASNKLSLSNDNIEILDVLHYYSLKYSFLLTNKFILKFRVNVDLFHLLNILNKHKNNNLNDKKKDSIYYKLKAIFKYSRSNRIPPESKCKLCKKRDSKIICPKCKRAVYCCEEHMNDDFKNIHFFHCEMNICIEKLEKEKRKSENLTEINYVIISFKNILNQIFIFIENKKDYINYTVFLKIMLNILAYINIEGIMNGVLSPMRTKLSNDYRKVCDKIFIIELWFFYCNLNILYITFTIKSEMYYLATHLLNLAKIVDLIEKKDAKLATMFAYFSLANDLTQYQINNKEEIENYTKNFFFDLLEIYTNENKNGKYLYIYEQFFIYYLHTFSSLLKIQLFLKEKTKTLKGIGAINVDKIVCYVPKLFEDKLNNSESSDIESPLKIPLILIYYYLSFILVKIDKISNAINLLRYILGEIRRINSHKDNRPNANVILPYSSLEAKIYLNIGILMNYNGDFNLGIHHLENCYRLCFEEKLSIYLNMKVLEMLCLAYINHDKIDTAFILVKNAISLRKKFLSERKKKFNATMLIYKLNLFKLKIYLLFIYQYISFKYQKMNNFLNMKSIKSKNKMIKNPDDMPTSITSLPFNKISPALIGYICEEDKKKKKAEILKDKINKDEEMFKFELDSNIDKFVIFCYSGKLEMIIKALEFLYKLTEKEYDILNTDNGPTQKEESKDENYNMRERSSSISRDLSMSYSKTVGYKERLNFFFKEDNETFLDEIEVKMGLYEKLSDAQQKELKTIENNIFRRSILLRDPKGKIDKFNLNYHPKYTLEFFELFSKLNETVFLNQLEKFGVGEQYEGKIFGNKSNCLIYSLRKYLNLEKIQNILYIQKVKLFEKYKDKLILIQKNDYKETVTKNKVVANDYISKLKEKFSKDKFLKNMNMEGLYEKLVNELTNKELNFILENPNRILNYIYINSKPLPEFPLDKEEKIFDKEDSKKSLDDSSEEESSSDADFMAKKEKEKEKKVEIKTEKKEVNGNEENKKEEEKKVGLSPRTIYNNLIDLISEKRSGERTKNKKRTVNFRNVKISKILDYVENKKIYGKRSLNPNRNWFRSSSLNPKKYPVEEENIQRRRGKSTTSYLHNRELSSKIAYPKNSLNDIKINKDLGNQNLNRRSNNNSRKNTANIIKKFNTKKMPTIISNKNEDDSIKKDVNNVTNEINISAIDDKALENNINSLLKKSSLFRKSEKENTKKEENTPKSSIFNKNAIQNKTKEKTKTFVFEEDLSQKKIEKKNNTNTNNTNTITNNNITDNNNITNNINNNNKISQKASKKNSIKNKFSMKTNNNPINNISNYFNKNDTSSKSINNNINKIKIKEIGNNSNNKLEKIDKKNNDKNYKLSRASKSFVSKKSFNYNLIETERNERTKEKSSKTLIKSREKGKGKEKRNIYSENNNIQKIELNITENSKKEQNKAFCFLNRKKPTYKEFREKVLHRNDNNSNYS